MNNLDRDHYVQKGGCMEGAVFLFLAIFLSTILLPYAILSFLPALIIYRMLKEKHSLTYGKAYLTTFFTTTTFNLLFIAVLFLAMSAMGYFDRGKLEDFIFPGSILIIGLIITLYGTAYVFYRALNKKIKFSSSFRYSIFIIIPITVFLQILPIILTFIYLMHKFNIPIPSIDEIKRSISEAMQHIR